MAKSKRLIEKNLELHVEGSAVDLGSLQHKVMTSVVEGRFDDAVKVLEEYQEKKKYYPSYAIKTDRLFTHSEELINAIKAKKNFPNLAGLTQNKQEELSQKVKEHWEELKISLRRLKTIEKDLEIEDAKSTLWVVRAIIFAVMVIIIAFVVQEAILSMGIPVKVAADDLLNMVWSLF